MAAFVVTGGFGALGQAVARAAAVRGWTVVLLDVAHTIPPDLPKGDLVCLPGVDLLDAATTEKTFQAIDAHHAGVGALANLAGGFVWAPIEKAGPETWQHLYAMNVLTAVSASRAALPALRRCGGSIVNVGANGALRAAAGMGPYAAAKSCVHRFTEALAEETRGSGVRVNAVLPSIIDTTANRRDMPGADMSNWLTPADVAEVILFLVSESAKAINGVLLPVTL